MPRFSNYCFFLNYCHIRLIEKSQLLKNNVILFFLSKKVISTLQRTYDKLFQCFKIKSTKFYGQFVWKTFLRSSEKN